MTPVAIETDRLGKCYRIGQAQNAPYQTLREQISNTMLAPVRRMSQMIGAREWRSGQKTNGPDRQCWALKDLSIEIRPGEVVGIIGRNGAGKSTLLKILSCITEPTEGIAEVWGRVGSLLEVGTGFHPELTGRENIYLNGAILGMQRQEIQRKFDEIVAFAEVERFLDTPVKYYSSGMYLRLAFAVAAHLQPEILLVDEVLAVGDARFQRKCLNKMGEVGRQGRTVLFVSHSMPSITRLCERAILLDGGRLIQDGRSDQVVSAYLRDGLSSTAEREWGDEDQAPAGNVARLRAVRVRGKGGQTTDVVDIRQEIAIEMEYEVLQSGYILMPHFYFFNDEGVLVFIAHDLDRSWRGRRRPKGHYVSRTWIPGNLLAEGTVFVHANMITLEPVIKQFMEADALVFQVVDNISHGDTARGDWAGPMKGIVRPMLRWETQYRRNGCLLPAIPVD